MDNGWEASARAWIADQGTAGDFGRACVLDAPMLERVRLAAPGTALDVGCGEGRFCRILAARGIRTTGIEPTATLRRAARDRDPAGIYLDGRAEALPFGDASFDLVVSYLTLIDIDDIDRAIPEMARVLAPGGRLLIANLNSFNTCGAWEAIDGTRRFVIDDYLEERATWVEWRGIRIRNWHRPLSRYMQPLLATGLRLTHLEEPRPTRGDPAKAERYARVPYFHIMEWRRD